MSESVFASHRTVASPRMLQAMNFVAVAHDGHYRKKTNIPYISHLYAVMYLLSMVTDDEDILIAGLCHDVLEDVPEKVTPDLLLETFGSRVLAIVQGVTKDDTLSEWQARCDAYLAHLAQAASKESVLVSVADKLHNLMSILADYEVEGEKLWDRFNAGKQKQQWWYRSVLEVAEARLEPNVLLVELRRHVTVFDSL